MTCDRTHLNARLLIRAMTPSGLAITAALVLLATFAGLAGAGMAREEFSRTWERTLTLSAGQKLAIENSNGEVTVKTGAGSQVRVVVMIQVSANSLDEATRFGNGIQIEALSNASEALFRTDTPSIQSNRSTNLSWSVDYQVTVPVKTALRVENRFGNTAIFNIEAPVSIDNAHGQVTLQDGKGSHRIKNSFGGVEVTRNAGDVTITNSNGIVSAVKVDGLVRIDDRFGDVTAEGITGPLTITSANGEVRVTDAGAADVTNSFGDVEARTVRGNLKIQNSNGDVLATGVEGMAELNTSFGKVSFDGVKGAVVSRASNSSVSGIGAGSAVTVTASFGEISLTNVGGQLVVNNANGDIVVQDVRAAATLNTSFGLVTARNIQGPLSIENSNGGVKALGVTGSAKVRTSFSPVLLERVTGSIDVVNQNGSIEVTTTPPAKGASCNELSLKTSFGNISVSVGESAAYDVDARTSFGDISTDFPLHVSESDLGTTSSLRGTLGKGGCQMTLMNSNGTIEIWKVGKRQ